MWLSRSFSVGLGIHLVLASIFGFLVIWLALAEAELKYILAILVFPPTYIYLVGVWLWSHHRHLRRLRKETNIALWVKSLSFVIVSVVFYVWVAGGSALLSDTQSRGISPLVIPLIYPLYLLAISVIGLARAWQLRPGPPGLPLPREW